MPYCRRPCCVGVVSDVAAVRLARCFGALFARVVVKKELAHNRVGQAVSIGRQRELVVADGVGFAKLFHDDGNGGGVVPMAGPVGLADGIQGDGNLAPPWCGRRTLDLGKDDGGDDVLVDIDAIRPELG